MKTCSLDAGGHSLPIRTLPRQQAQTARMQACKSHAHLDEDATQCSRALPPVAEHTPCGCVWLAAARVSGALLYGVVDVEPAPRNVVRSVGPSRPSLGRHEEPDADDGTAATCCVPYTADEYA